VNSKAVRAALLVGPFCKNVIIWKTPQRGGHIPKTGRSSMQEKVAVCSFLTSWATVSLCRTTVLNGSVSCDLSASCKLRQR
jgi:hypothetical protein